MIRNYSDFVHELLRAGFSQFGGTKDSVASLFPYGWGAEPEDGVAWFSGDPDRDPWDWRMRVLERDDVAYAKVFFRKSASSPGNGTPISWRCGGPMGVPSATPTPTA